MAQFSGRFVSAGDAGMLVSGVVVVVASFLPWYGWRAGDTYHLTYTAWDNVFALVAVLLVAVAVVLATIRMFDGVRLPPIGPIGPSFLLVLLPAAAVVLIVVGWLTVGEATDPVLRSVLEGEARYGLFMGMGGALVQLVFAALAFQASGDGFSGRGREVAPPPVPYGQPYGPQPTPGYWPHAPYGQAQPSPGRAQPPTNGDPRQAYPQPTGAAAAHLQPGLPPFAPLDGPSPYARPVAQPPPGTRPTAAGEILPERGPAPAADAPPGETGAETPDSERPSGSSS